MSFPSTFFWVLGESQLPSLQPTQHGRRRVWLPSWLVVIEDLKSLLCDDLRKHLDFPALPFTCPRFVLAIKCYMDLCRGRFLLAITVPYFDALTRYRMAFLGRGLYESPLLDVCQPLSVRLQALLLHVCISLTLVKPACFV